VTKYSEKGLESEKVKGKVWRAERIKKLQDLYNIVGESKIVM
jgi:hypothetical protein